MLAEAQRLNLLSDEHFTVDGALLESWASLKSSDPRMVKSRREVKDATPRWTFAGNNGRMKRTTVWLAHAFAGQNSNLTGVSCAVVPFYGIGF